MHIDTIYFDQNTILNQYSSDGRFQCLEYKEYNK